MNHTFICVRIIGDLCSPSNQNMIKVVNHFSWCKIGEDHVPHFSDWLNGNQQYMVLLVMQSFTCEGLECKNSGLD